MTETVDSTRNNVWNGSITQQITVFLVLPATFLAGVWLGHWMVPTEALTDAAVGTDGNLVYRPVHPNLFGTSIAVMMLSLIAWLLVYGGGETDEEEAEEGETAVEGGETHG